MKAFGSASSRFTIPFAIMAICLGVLVAPYAKDRIVAAGPAADPVLKGTAAYGDWHSDHPGVIRLITPADLPKPYATSSARNQPRVVPQPEGAWPQVLPGFKIERLTTGFKGFKQPRLLRTAPNGDIFIADSVANEILVMHGVGQGSGTITPQVFATGLTQPFGIAFYPPDAIHNIYMSAIRVQLSGFHTEMVT
jgi:glucose/arabinose dehydrogenase